MKHLINTYKKLTPLLILTISSLIVNYAYAQSSEMKPKQQWKIAEKYLFSEDFDQALSIYESLYKDKQGNHFFAYKIGYIHIIREDKQNVKAAIDFLILATENTHKKSKNRFKEKRAPVNSWYYLGIAYRLDGQYENAIDAFNRFKNNMSRKNRNSVQGQFIDREIKSCRDAMEFIDYRYMKIEKIVVEDLKDPFVRCPILCNDANLLIFTNGKYNIFPPDLNYDREPSEGPFDQVFMAQRDENGRFHSPVNISKDLDIFFPYIPVTATADCSELYLIVDEGDNGQIYMSRFEDEKYQKAAPVRSLNTRRWESHASITPDGQRIYFTSDRRGGHGGLDIWYADRNEEGNWGKPVNMGPEINTPYHEEMPYISRDGNELYFSSEGHTNIGGFDVFWSRYDSDNEKWMNPENLGYPFSTIGNDMGYIVENPPHFVFCPINDNKRRQGVEDCDCISITEEAVPRLADLTGIVKIEKSEINLPEKSRLRVVIVDSNDEKHNVEINTDGTFHIEGIEPGIYDFIVYNNNDFIHSEIFNVPATHDDLIVDISIMIPQTGFITDFLESLEPYTTDILADSDTDTIDEIPTPDTDTDASETYVYEQIDLPDGFIHVRSVMFERNSSVVRDLYKDNLNNLAAFLKEYPDSKIELHAYCSQTGSFEYNKRLGNKRAESVKYMLISMGAGENQISIKNHVQNNPIAIGDHHDSRIYNQRVDIKSITNPDIINNVQVYVPTFYRTEQADYDYSKGTFFYPHSEVISKIVIEPVLFDFDKYTIKPVHYDNLNLLVEYLKSNPEAQIKFYGHTDHYGSKNYNDDLSSRRVNSVKTYLLNKGVNENQIVAEYKGETQPITVLTDDDIIRRLNRRVENYVLKSGEGKIISMPVIVPVAYQR